MPRRPVELVAFQMRVSVPAAKWLESRAAELGISKAELLRRMVDSERLRPPEAERRRTR